MSEKICNTVNKIGEQLNCPICLENLSTPKTLFCLHTFCQQCLENLPIDPKRNLSCPTCQSPCELPVLGVAGLPTAFFVDNLTEVHDLLRRVVSSDPVLCNSCGICTATSYCKQCNIFTCGRCTEMLHSKMASTHGHIIVDVDEIATAVSGVFDHDVIRCSSHDQPLELYCNTCQQLVCCRCCMSVHKKHDYSYVSDIFTENCQVLESMLCLVEQQIPLVAKAVANLSQRQHNIIQCSKQVKKEINYAITEMINLLKKHQAELTAQVDIGMKQKLETISDQLLEAKTTLLSLEDCRTRVKEALSNGTPQQILANKQQMINHSNSLLETCVNNTFTPLEESDFKLQKNDANTNLLNLLKVKYHLIIAPTKVTSAYQHIPIVGRESTVSITFSSSIGSAIPLPPSCIQCYLTPPNGDTIIEHTIKETGIFGTYDVIFTPFVRGEHCIRVTVCGKDVPGSPLTIPVSILPEMRGMPVSVIGDLERPWGIDVTENGRVIVGEWESACTMIHDYDGMRKQKYLGERGSRKGQFNHPSGICMTGRNTFLVSDTGNNRIQEITREGKCVACVGSQGNGPLQFKFPRGISISKTTQQVYIADDENHRIQVLNADLTFANSFGKYGNRLGQFNRPRDIAFDTDGNLFVTDVDNHRIQKFSPKGHCLSTFGTFGSKPGQLNLPVGITIDDNNQLYVTESGNRRVSVFSPNGDFICCFNGWGGKNGGDRLCDPREIAFDNKGHLYVCDWGKGCVIVF